MRDYYKKNDAIPSKHCIIRCSTLSCFQNISKEFLVVFAQKVTRAVFICRRRPLKF